LINIEQEKNFTKWLNLTHLHTDGHDAVKNLFEYTINDKYPNFSIDESAKGFYAPETLVLAANAVLKSKKIFEVFINSQVPDGDNDSIAALAFGLWYLKHGANKTDLRHLARFTKEDLFKLNCSIT
jgi:ADP-ribosylglycohydrolase